MADSLLIQESIKELTEGYEIAELHKNERAAAVFKLALLERLEQFANTIDTQ